MADLAARETYASTIARTYAFATDAQFGTRLIRMVRTRINLLHEAWDKFRDAHILVMQNTVADEDRETHRREYVTIEEQFAEADAIMQERLEEVNRPMVEHHEQSEHSENEQENDEDDERAHHQPNRSLSTTPQTQATTDTPASVATMTPNVQVGQYPAAGQQLAQMPWQFRIENIWGEFDGDKEQWQSFHDSFKANVYDDPVLPAVRKFQILKSALKGKAAKSLGQWQISDRNFEAAWQRLKKLYDDPYGTSKQLLQRILSLTKMESANGYKLQIISNVTQEVSRQLSALGLPAEHYDLMFIHTVQGKLDQKTSMDWDTKRGGNTQPTLNEFTDFLDARAKALSNAYQLEHGHETHKSKERKRPFDGQRNQSDNKRHKPNTSSAKHTTVKNEKQGCATCSEEHATRKCEKFLKLSLTKRKDKAKEAGLCFNCLSRGHSSKDCKAGNCNRCDKKHNSLLCPENPNNRQLNSNQVTAKKNSKNKTKPKNKSQ